MADVEVALELGGRTRRIGRLRRHSGRGGESTTFEYDGDWLRDENRFSIEPAIALGSGPFAAGAGRLPGALSDSAPDTWGRRLLQRAERRDATRERRPIRTLSETTYLLGVADVARMGALRFRYDDDEPERYRATVPDVVPPLVRAGRLLAATERVLRDDETDEDLRLLVAPGSSLGGARPKASIVDARGRLAIAKFPKETDDYSVERWEAIALRLAANAGIDVPEHDLIDVDGKPVLLSTRFDRANGERVPFLSAMSLLAATDGERASYPDIVDALAPVGASVAADAARLYRRMAFNVLVSNVDDHLRNHGFLRRSRAGWSLSPAFDLNPTPADVRARILTTSIDLDDGTCSIELVDEVAPYFGLAGRDARAIVGEVATATAAWRDAARELAAPRREIERMASAFEHDDLRRALALR